MTIIFGNFNLGSVQIYKYFYNNITREEIRKILLKVGHCNLTLGNFKRNSTVLIQGPRIVNTLSKFLLNQATDHLQMCRNTFVRIRPFLFFSFSSIFLFHQLTLMRDIDQPPPSVLNKKINLCPPYGL